MIHWFHNTNQHYFITEGYKAIVIVMFPECLLFIVIYEPANEKDFELKKQAKQKVIV